MPNNISKPTIKILLIQYDRPGCQETSYSDRPLNTCLPWLRTTFKILLFSRRKVKFHYVFLQKFPNKLDQKYCHTLKGQEKTANKS